MAPELKQSATTELSAAAAEAFAIQKELEEVRGELQLGRDLAGVGDDSLAKAREQRRQVKAAQDAEQRVLAGYAAASRDRSKSSKLVGLADRAGRISEDLDQTDKQIDQIVDKGLETAKATIAAERKNIEDYKAELNENEVESRAVGSTVLAKSFADVKAKFDDIVIRTDVGAIRRAVVAKGRLRRRPQAADAHAVARAQAAQGRVQGHPRCRDARCARQEGPGARAGDEHATADQPRQGWWRAATREAGRRRPDTRRSHREAG